METCIHSSRSCLPFYTIPIFPLFKSNDFSFACLLFFFCILKFFALRNILPWAIYCTCVYVVLSELCYACTPNFSATIANMGQL